MGKRIQRKRAKRGGEGGERIGKEEEADRAAQKATQKTTSKQKINYVNILLAGLVCACALYLRGDCQSSRQYAVASFGGHQDEPGLEGVAGMDERQYP